MTEGANARFRFGPLEKRGLLAGWRASQAAIIAVGLLVAVGCLRALSTGPAIVAAIVSVGLSVATATWPIAGRTGDEWIPDVARHGAKVAFGRTWRAPSHPTSPNPRLPQQGLPSKSGRGGQVERGANRGPFSSLRILHVESGAAVVYDAGERTYTVVLPASGPGFVLLGASERDGRVAGWATALGALARQGSPVHRIQWVARAFPGQEGLAENLRHSTASAGSKGLQTIGAARASYEELLVAARPEMRRHQILLSMSIRAGRPGLQVRPPSAQDHATSCAVLLRELSAFRRRLSDVEVETAPALSPRALASVMRSAFSSSRWAWPEECGTTWPWPVASEVTWDAVRMDGTWHATYWIAEWPRTEVSADFLAPLLLSGDIRQSIAVTMEPLSPLEATRLAQRARTADVADAELRRKGGFLQTARREKEEETVVQRESELADGHSPFRFSGYVTVSSDTHEDLDASCGRVEQAAGQVGMEVRRCYGDQQRAFCFTLPLGRGLT